MEARHYSVHANVLHFLFPQWESAALPSWGARWKVNANPLWLRLFRSSRIALPNCVSERNGKSRRRKRKKPSIHANYFVVGYCDGCDDNDYGGFALCFCFRIKCLRCARFIKFSVFTADFFIFFFIFNIVFILFLRSLLFHHNAHANEYIKCQMNANFL